VVVRVKILPVSNSLWPILYMPDLSARLASGSDFLHT
jgi:hypothetical protein